VLAVVALLAVNSFYQVQSGSEVSEIISCNRLMVLEDQGGLSSSAMPTAAEVEAKTVQNQWYDWNCRWYFWRQRKR
jgi:hypothetical protein